ncbi:MAG: aldolase/citrate lyase family protein [Acidobacteriota bacterium]
MLHPNKLSRKLSAGEPVLGTWVFYTDPCAAELLAMAGFDYLLIDIEHSCIGREALRDIIMAVDGHPCVPLVRVKVNDLDSIKVALDCGAGGVVIPQINTGADAKRAVEWTKYAPLGKRGIGAVRASAYVSKWKEYTRVANQNVLTIVQVEDTESVRNLQEILSCPGIDGIFIGSMDLSQSMGIPVGESHPRLTEAIDYVIAAATEANLPIGIPCADMPEAEAMMKKGILMPTVSSDIEFMSQGAGLVLDRWNSQKSRFNKPVARR